MLIVVWNRLYGFSDEEEKGRHFNVVGLKYEQDFLGFICDFKAPNNSLVINGVISWKIYNINHILNNLIMGTLQDILCYRVLDCVLGARKKIIIYEITDLG